VTNSSRWTKMVLLIKKKTDLSTYDETRKT